jgi:hypothetical protein
VDALTGPDYFFPLSAFCFLLCFKQKKIQNRQLTQKQ